MTYFDGFLNLNIEKKDDLEIHEVIYLIHGLGFACRYFFSVKFLLHECFGSRLQYFDT